MKSNYKKLAPYIRQIDERNKDLEVKRLLGVSIGKRFIESIANTIGTDMTSYKIVRKGQFAYGPVTSRNGDKVSIALLEEDECIISSSYNVFEITDTDTVLPEYLNLWFKRPEFDRYARFHSHGSAREIFDWEEMCNVTLPIPSIEEQQKIVDAYNTIERRIAIKRQINDNLESQISSLFKSKFFQNASCEYGVLNDLVITTLGGDWGEANNNLKCKVRCIRGTDIPVLNVGIISNAPTRYIPYKNCETKHLIPNDLVVEISGGSPTQSTGRIAIMTQRTLNKTSEPFICSNFCRILRIKPSYISYFLQLWKYLYSCGRMFCYENSSTGLKNFDLEGFLQEENIFIPDEITAQEFNSTIFPIIEQQQVNGDEIEALTELSNNILSTRLSKLSR